LFTEVYPGKEGVPSGVKALAAGFAGAAIGAAGAAMLSGLGKKDEETEGKKDKEG
jgi:hypothetical protein